MDLVIYPEKLAGTVTAIPSKSQAHRLLICAAFSNNSTQIHCPETNQDIEATAACLNAIGADILRTSDGYIVNPISTVPKSAEIDCRESGSTLRFMLPVVCALGISTTIHMSGRLPYRPLSPMWEELERMGCKLSRPTDRTLYTSGKLKPGEYMIPGNISSQFITGLLLALPLLNGPSSIQVVGRLESAPYVKMTQDALALFGVKSKEYLVEPAFPFNSPGRINVEGDWSNAAFFLVAACLENSITVNNLNPSSSQGDRAVVSILTDNIGRPVISAANIPDLIPILAVYFAAKDGAVFTNIGRLRLKESDRVASVINMLGALGIQAEADENTLRVPGGSFTGGTVDSCGDHRIAMAAAIASTVANDCVTILGAECVAKSYPSFWQEFKRLGGKYEQYIR